LALTNRLGSIAIVSFPIWHIKAAEIGQFKTDKSGASEFAMGHPEDLDFTMGDGIG
jgi:hypothetical protein